MNRNEFLKLMGIAAGVSLIPDLNWAYSVKMRDYFLIRTLVCHPDLTDISIQQVDKKSQRFLTLFEMTFNHVFSSICK